MPYEWCKQPTALKLKFEWTESPKRSPEGEHGNHVQGFMLDCTYSAIGIDMEKLPHTERRYSSLCL